MRPLFAGALVVGGLGSLSSSRADVEVTLQQAAGASQTPPPAQTVRLFCKGRNARLEVSGGPVVLYDGKSGIIHTLDPAHKTYYTTLFSQVYGAGEPAESGPGGPKENTKLNLNQTDQTTILAGVTARKYVVTGTITFTRSQPPGRRGGMGGGRGGRRRGGGFPFPVPLVGSATIDQYGGGGEGGRGDNAPALPLWSLSGEVWLSDAVKFPAKEDVLPAAQLAAASAGPFLQPLADALGKRGELPLLARLTVTRTPPPAGGGVDRFGGVMEGAPPPPTALPTTTATTLTVQSVSMAPLSDTLFQTPLDDTLVPAPVEPFVPGAPAPPATD